ncbi:MAG: T9SS type A sorting domain-containing protein [Flavobacteriales bacterium]
MSKLLLISTILFTQILFAQNFPEKAIGTTTFDLQTNGSSQKRIVNNSDGTISATWMYSGNPNSKSPSDRGTGYNYYNGTTWKYNAGNIISRIETQRTGWPNMLMLANGKEVVISHRNSDTSLLMLSRNTKGTGAWTEKKLFPGQHLLWSRAVAGGPDGNTIHLIAATPMTDDGGSLVYGMDGNMLYSKSTDGGVNWTTPDTIAGVDTSWTVSIKGDYYNIDANGNNVAIVLACKWMDVVLLKSTDNGDHWTKKIVSDFPYDKFDETKTLVTDTPYTCDGSTEILVDNNGKAHIWYGFTRLLNHDLGDSSISYYPGVNGLYYWNETEFLPHVIAQAIDLDGDNTISTAKINYKFPSYGVGLSSMPSAGIDDKDVLYLVYSAFNEECYSPGDSINYRHIYAVKSEDGGNNWSLVPNDITPVADDDKYHEYVYPSLAKHVDSHLHVIVQEDDTPGTYIIEENMLGNYNSIMYLKVSTALNVSVNEIKKEDFPFVIHPNPSNNSNIHLIYELKESENITVNIYNVLGERIESKNLGNQSAGKQQFTFSAASFNTGIYFVEVNSGNKSACEKLVIQ